MEKYMVAENQEHPGKLAILNSQREVVMVYRFTDLKRTTDGKLKLGDYVVLNDQNGDTYIERPGVEPCCGCTIT